MENENDHPKKHRNGFLVGFLLGFLIGGIVVFLFATKKGKKILQILTEEGLSRASQLGAVVDEYIYDDYDEKSKPVRRFFRKSSSKAN